MAELSFMDSSGLHILLDCHRTCLAEGTSLHLAAAYGVPARVLEVTGAAGYLPGHATVQEAIATVLRRP
ncbi:STAS domain-containing protein [Nonomuraea sp. NPDC049709]|uniref:STAS domain-containing protein n=1 Tax=Nonomuraea sp. NPDC049709 TaxID=3154736 RepID=UPI003416EBB6